MAIRDYRPRRRARGAISRPKELSMYLVLLVAIGLQISYPLIDGETLRLVTIAIVYWSAGVMALHALFVYGWKYFWRLLTITLILSYVFEAIGSKTGWPFGNYTYDVSLGYQIFGVPLVVPFAWLMMAHPALIIARRMTQHWVFLYGGLILMAWDFALDPQMVAANRWRWEFSGRAVPFEPNIPLSNAFGWLLTGMALVAILHLALPRERRKITQNNVVNIFLGWTLFSTIVGNVFFFDRPGVAFLSGLSMSALVLPYFVAISMGRND